MHMKSRLVHHPGFRRRGSAGSRVSPRRRLTPWRWECYRARWVESQCAEASAGPRKDVHGRAWREGQKRRRLHVGKAQEAESEDLLLPPGKRRKRFSEPENGQPLHGAVFGHDHTSGSKWWGSLSEQGCHAVRRSATRPATAEGSPSYGPRRSTPLAWGVAVAELYCTRGAPLRRVKN